METTTVLIIVITTIIMIITTVIIAIIALQELRAQLPQKGKRVIYRW